MRVSSPTKIAMIREPQGHQSGCSRTGIACEIDTAMRFSGIFSFVAADSVTLRCVCWLSKSQKLSKSSASRMGVLINILDFFLDIISFLRYFTTSFLFALFYIILLIFFIHMLD